MRDLILEGEKAASGVGVFPDKSRPDEWGARLLARSGYVDEAAALWAKSGGNQIYLIRARTYYGQFEIARKEALSASSPEKRSGLLGQIADVLWKMGQPAQARQVLEEARTAAAQITDPQSRGRRLSGIQDAISSLAGDPPVHMPEKVRHGSPVVSPVPPFPVNTDGYRYRDPKKVASEAEDNARYLTRLFELAVAGDREGLVQLTVAARSPFQRTLAFATLAHVFIQLSRPHDAEEYARLIEEDREDCSLAKAEALDGVAMAWIRNGQTKDALRCFDDALHLLSTVRPDLAFGRSVVVAKVGIDQWRSERVHEAEATIELSVNLAKLASARPKPVNGVYPKGSLDNHTTREDALRQIFEMAAHARMAQSARKVAKAYREAVGRGVDMAIIQIWVGSGDPAEAEAYVHGMEDKTEGAQALFVLVQSWLDHNGVPVF
jgi:tetratricopeptide (TPR) repeat protein